MRPSDLKAPEWFATVFYISNPMPIFQKYTPFDIGFYRKFKNRCTADNTLWEKHYFRQNAIMRPIHYNAALAAVVIHLGTRDERAFTRALRAKH